jgi:ribosomal protein L15E
MRIAKEDSAQRPCNDIVLCIRRELLKAIERVQKHLRRSLRRQGSPLTASVKASTASIASVYRRACFGERRVERKVQTLRVLESRTFHISLRSQSR